MAEKKTLLDLDRLPTLEEMQDFFKENDWSAAKMFTEPKLADAISHGKELLAPPSSSPSRPSASPASSRPSTPPPRRAKPSCLTDHTK